MSLPKPTPSPRFSRWSALGALVLFFSACGGGGGSTPSPTPPPTPTLTAITLDPASANVNVGSMVDLTATGRFSSGTTTVPYDAQVVWTSSAANVATVNGSGQVNALAAGTATITATAQGITASAVFTVSATPSTLTSITLDPTSSDLPINGTVDLRATGHYSNGTSTVPFDAQVSWTSSTPGVATVDGAGLVTAKAVGTTSITATSGAISASASIRVLATPPLSSIAVTPSTSALTVGGTVDLSATATFGDGSTIPNYDAQVTWGSTASAVASVDANGLVTAVGAGAATITATKGLIQGTATITVTSPGPTLSSITLSPASSSLTIGQAVDITATATYSDGTSGAIDNSSVWTSSAPTVASVDAMGLVTALLAGSSTITAAKGGKSGTATITVNPSGPTLTGITVSPTSKALSVGQTQELTASAVYSNGTGSSPYTVNWASSNPAVATVAQGTWGVVTAVSAGSATITASANGFTANCNIAVTATVVTLTSITIDLAPSTSGTVGQTMDVTATGHFSDGSVVTPYDSQVSWASSNPAVATVTNLGLVTAVGAGTATITASKNGLSASGNLTITQPTFDSRLVGRWQWVGMINSSTSVGSFYTFNANGTFTYSLIQQTSSGCIAYSRVVAYHEGTFSSVGSLDNPASAGKIVMTCSTHYVDWTNCGGSTSRTNAVDPNGNATPNPHFHWAAFINANTLATNHADDFMATGTLNHARQ